MRKIRYQVALISSILTAVGCFLFLILLYLLDFNPLGQYKLLYLPIYALGIVGGLKFFRDQRNGGFISGSQSVFMALIINVFAATLYAILVYNLLAYVDKNILELHKNELALLLVKTKTAMVEQFNLQQYEALYASIKSISASSVAIDEWVKMSAIGFVLAMAIAVIMKKSPPPTLS
jgi:hypothetical protein